MAPSTTAIKVDPPPPPPPPPMLECDANVRVAVRGRTAGTAKRERRAASLKAGRARSIGVRVSVSLES